MLAELLLAKSVSFRSDTYFNIFTFYTTCSNCGDGLKQDITLRSSPDSVFSSFKHSAIFQRMIKATIISQIQLRGMYTLCNQFYIIC